MKKNNSLAEKDDSSIHSEDKEPSEVQSNRKPMYDGSDNQHETFNWKQIIQIVGSVLIALGISGLIKLIVTGK